MLPLLLVALFFGAMAESSSSFFPSDLTTVKWAHAVNSRDKLNNALKSAVNMLEADVSLSSNNTPIMAHPPATDSDLTLQEFLTSVKNSTKGIKLDFKSTPAFNASVPILITHMNDFSKVPVWLNADILKGPGGKEPGVTASVFLEICKTKFNGSTLSLGWTTEWSGTENYTLDAVKEMNSTLVSQGIVQPVTFAVRGALVARSGESMKALVAYKNSTLTVWSSGDDRNISYDSLRKTILDIGRNRTFVDMPEDQRKSLNLPSSGTRAVLSSACVLIATALYAVNLW